jgi:uncharacterized RDD family membrane protein YckC
VKRASGAPAPARETPAQLAALPTPSLARRAACMLYEAVVMFGVALLPAVLATVATQIVGDGTVAALLSQVIGFLCFGQYFVWSWTRQGQTLPMQTWRIRLIRADGQLLSRGLAWRRYALAWAWVAPAIVLAHLAGWNRWWALGAAAVWALAYGSLALSHAQRQFLHDRLCGTRLVQLPPAARSAA